jgi:hypothetical protein
MPKENSENMTEENSQDQQNQNLSFDEMREIEQSLQAFAEIEEEELQPPLKLRKLN